MQRDRRMWWALAACGALVLGAIVWNAHVKQREAAASVFFAAVLRQEHIRERIVVDEVAYTVSDGEVTREDHKTTTARETFDALRIAYALMLAQRSPLLAVPGTDPEKLDQAVTLLAKVALELASIQKDNPGKEAVESSLYPIDFLRSLASLERARRTFIQTGSDADESRYEDAAKITVHMFEKDLRLHKAAFTHIVPQDAVAYHVFGGTMTRETLINSMDALMRGIQGTSAALEKQRVCISGTVDACDTSRLKLRVPALTPVLPSDTDSPNATVFMQEMRSSYARATGNTSYVTGPVFKLVSSACMDNFDTPLLFVVQDRRKGVDATITLEFVGDILFVPTASYKDIPYYRYFADNHVPYAYFPIWEHYKCPEIALDTARVFWTGTIRDAAQAERFSQYAIGSDAATLRVLEARLAYPPLGIVRESDAREYIARALHALSQGSDTPPRIMQTLQDISLANEYGTTRFEQFIRRLTRDEEANIGLMRANVPVALGAEYLFYIRSGFFSLFLGTNPSVAGVQRPPVDSTKPSSEIPFVRYTILSVNVPQAELVRDMAFFFETHRKAKRRIPVE